MSVPHKFRNGNECQRLDEPNSIRNVKTVVDQHDLIIKRSHLNDVIEFEKTNKHRTESVIYPSKGSHKNDISDKLNCSEMS